MTAAAQPLANHESPARDSASVAGTDRFLVLDGLRGVAAFAVILDHVASATLRSWFPGRYLAVDFFFVLSGFVLAHAYGRRLGQHGLAQRQPDGAGDLSVLAFLRIRLIRLYPLYLLGLAIALIAPLVGMMRGWGGNPAGELASLTIALHFARSGPTICRMRIDRQESCLTLRAARSRSAP